MGFSSSLLVARHFSKVGARFDQKSVLHLICKGHIERIFEKRQIVFLIFEKPGLDLNNQGPIESIFKSTFCFLRMSAWSLRCCACAHCVCVCVSVCVCVRERERERESGEGERKREGKRERERERNREIERAREGNRDR